MENKQEKNVNALTFDNLRSLSTLLSGNEFNAFVGGINKARKALDTYCKALKDREKAFSQTIEQPTEQEVKQVMKYKFFKGYGKDD